jgi:hypothetical protein
VPRSSRQLRPTLAGAGPIREGGKKPRSSIKEAIERYERGGKVLLDFDY